MPAWLEVRMTPQLAAAGVEICRAMRKNGALHVWRGEPEIKGLWPDTPKAQEAVARLEASRIQGGIRVRRFFAHDPKAVWQTFQPVPGGARAEAGARLGRGERVPRHPGDRPPYLLRGRGPPQHVTEP